MNIDKKNFLWNMIGSTSYAFISLFFTIFATRINGEEKAGIYSYAFATACILYILGSYVVRAFQVTDISGNFSDSDYIYNRIITCLLMMIISVLFVLIRGYSAYKSFVILILCLFKVFEAISELLYAFLQKNERLWQVGVSFFVKAVALTLIFLISDLLTENVAIACLSVTLCYLLLVLLFDLPNIKSISLSKSKFSFSRNNQLLKACFFTFAFTAMNTYLINAPRYAMDKHLSDSAQTIYGIIVLPATFMSLLGQYIIHPFLTKISKYIKEKDYQGLKKSNLTIIAVMAILGILVFGVAYFLEAPVLSLLFGIDLNNYRTEMLIIIAGSMFFGLETVVSFILIAFRKMTVLSVSLFIITIASIFLSKYAVEKSGIMGASVTYFILMSVASVICLIIFAFSMFEFKKSFRKVNL